jgi:hypothetical protein
MCTLLFETCQCISFLIKMYSYYIVPTYLASFFFFVCHNLCFKNVCENIVTYSGLFYSRRNFIALQKSTHYSLTQSATLRTHVDVRPTRSRNTHSYRILPTGPLLAIFQHSLQFMQSESFQTQVGTIHRRAIGRLAHHNCTSAHH